MNLIRGLTKICLALTVGIVLSGCVVRPLGWGDRGGHGRGDGHGDRHMSDPGSGRYQGHEAPRDGARRR